MLLAQPGRYRAFWASQADKLSPGEISQAAVARVIAGHLQSNGRLPPEDDRAHRALKDRVYRALNGQALTPSTLRLFAEAFLMSQEDARQLWSCLLGTTPDQTAEIIRTLRLPPADAAAFQPSDYRVVSLHEVHEVGADGAPSKHHTTQKLEASVDGVSRCPVRFDTSTLAVSVSGGDTSAVYKCYDGLYAVDILLPKTLLRGEIYEVSYTLRYQAPTWNDQRFQRSALRIPIDEARIEVHFSPHRRPRKIWWAIWQELRQDSTPTLREPVTLKGNSVTKKVTSAARTIFGFCWDW